MISLPLLVRLIGKMKRKYFKYVFKSLKNDFSRIVAIILIVILGNSFLVGLLSTTPDLFSSMDKYYDNTNFMDICIRSTVGFNEATLSYVENNIVGIDNISLTSDKEQYVLIDNVKAFAQISYRKMVGDTNNKLTLVEGRYPKNANECVLLVKNNSLAPYHINSTIKVDDETTLTVVGSVRNPLYITSQAEHSLTSGTTIEAYIYLDDNYFNNLTYTTLYIDFFQSKQMNGFSNEYDEFISKKVEDLQNISKKTLELRIAEIKQDYYDEVHDAVYLEVLNAVKESIKEQYGLDLTIEELLMYLESPAFSDYKKYIEDTTNEQTEVQLNEIINSLSPNWYILDRDSIQSAYMFKTDALKMQTISTIFPPFFFLIAMLVCLSSMSRIITRDRQYIGTLKALGFSKRVISLKYIFYGLISSLIGCVAGAFIGIFALPAVIMQIYSSVYYLGTFSFTLQPLYVFGFSSLMIVLLLLVVLIVILSNLREPAAQLMLGNKSPKPGKKILLERIPFLWKRIKFKYKSMFRNIFRFKKNLLMMIIGVGGCAGMLLTSFGLTDSFKVITNDQYNDITKYDALVLTSENNIDSSLIFDNLDANLTYDKSYYQRGSVSEDESYSLQIISAGNNLSEYVGFLDENHNKIDFNENSVILTKQISDDFNIHEGDLLKINTDFGEIEVKISDVCLNYVENYIYFGTNSFAKYFYENKEENVSYNSFLIKINEELDADKEMVLDSLVNNEYVSSIVSTTSTKQTYSSIINNLSMIVILIVCLSGALAAIVIYNLTDININERIREIATLRVCGYRRREVLMYILREIFVMSTIGIVVGLLIGLFLHWFIVTNIASIGLVFSTTINWPSYIYTILMSWVFVIIVSFCFYPKIRSINMAESLKSVD